ncbi:MAG: RNA polymerase-binding protein DksA, partial [Alphaproteobacteria bacterium]|nr:RNA polymerase-binding protein DksA [Alphaproteobacteria bacterium]
MTIDDLPEDYSPSDDEEFMNEKQKLYFKKQLENWREKLLQEFTQTLNQLQDAGCHESDIIDIANN